ncbi:MAG: ISAs1 family transposase [Actinomycetota bacterium]|nr:ISAs1 family transposase [Actinomycetota bacterium]
MLVHRAIAESYATAIEGLPSGSTTDAELPAAALAGGDLLQRLSGVSDGRSEQGRDQPVAAVLTLCAAAVLAGMRSFTAIAGWVTDVPTELLARLYARPATYPSKTTLWRVLTGADSAAVDAVVGAWLAEHAGLSEPTGAAGDDHGVVAVAVDGKTVRGAVDAQGQRVHLLAAATHQDNLVLGQVEVGAKTNEIPMFAPLLDSLASTGVDLAHVGITADALHAQRGHAEYLPERGAEFVFTVKHNQPGLFAALDALPWTTTPIAARDIQRGHGRVTTRTIQVLPAPPDLPFPHVNQVWLIERYVTDSTGGQSAVAVLGVTSLTPAHAAPERLAGLVRDHWGIKALHWLRDTVYREDASTAHTRSGPRVMTALRTLSIGALHLLGRRDITEATRWATRSMDRPFKILKLMN